MEKIIEKINETDKIIFAVDHLIYTTYPLIKDKQILIKSLLETKKAIKNCITIILQLEHFFRRIHLYRDPHLNLKTFKNKSSRNYGITFQEIEEIEELFDFVKKHEQSTMEISKDQKVIILSKNMEQKTLTIEKSKEFLILTKNILKKTKIKLSGKSIKTL